jgi:hypothetical protein
VIRQVSYVIDGNLHDKGWVTYATLGPVSEEHAAGVYETWQESRDQARMEIRYRLVRRTTESETVRSE